ncbi:hypothetical protein YC2023_106054 [Brassica napus]
MNRNMEKEATTKNLPESEISPNEVTIEVIVKGELDGKSGLAVFQVSILYTGNLKDTGKVFDQTLKKFH